MSKTETEILQAYAQRIAATSADDGHALAGLYYDAAAAIIYHREPYLTPSGVFQAAADHPDVQSGISGRPFAALAEVA